MGFFAHSRSLATAPKTLALRTRAADDLVVKLREALRRLYEEDKKSKIYNGERCPAIMSKAEQAELRHTESRLNVGNDLPGPTEMLRMIKLREQYRQLCPAQQRCAQEIRHAEMASERDVVRYKRCVARNNSLLKELEQAESDSAISKVTGLREIKKRLNTEIGKLELQQQLSDSLLNIRATLSENAAVLKENSQLRAKVRSARRQNIALKAKRLSPSMPPYIASAQAACKAIEERFDLECATTDERIAKGHVF